MVGIKTIIFVEINTIVMTIIDVRQFTIMLYYRTPENIPNCFIISFRIQLIIIGLRKVHFKIKVFVGFFRRAIIYCEISSQIPSH